MLSSNKLNFSSNNNFVQYSFAANESQQNVVYQFTTSQTLTNLKLTFNSLTFEFSDNNTFLFFNNINSLVSKFNSHPNFKDMWLMSYVPSGPNYVITITCSINGNKHYLNMIVTKSNVNQTVTRFSGSGANKNEDYNNIKVILELRRKSNAQLYDFENNTLLTNSNSVLVNEAVLNYHQNNKYLFNLNYINDWNTVTYPYTSGYWSTLFKQYQSQMNIQYSIPTNTAEQPNNPEIISEGVVGSLNRFFTIEGNELQSVYNDYLKNEYSLNSINDYYATNQTQPVKFLTRKTNNQVISNDNNIINYISYIFGGKTPLSSATTLYYKAEIIYDDLIIDTVTIDTILQAYAAVYTFRSDFNRISAFANPTKTIVGYKVFVVDENDILMTNKFTYRIDYSLCDDSEFRVNLVYKTKFGVYEAVTFTSDIQEENQTSSNVFALNQKVNQQIYERQRLQTDTNIVKTLIVTSQTLTYNEYSSLEDLVTTESLFIYKNNQFVPVIVSNSNYNYDTKADNNKIILELQYA